MERRQRRSEHPGTALFYQLDTCRERAALEAMILADEDGLCVASSGRVETCEELAAHMALVCDRVPYFEGTMLSSEERRDVFMKRFRVNGEELYLCAVGGNMAMRVFEVQRSETGVTRILGDNILGDN